MGHSNRMVIKYSSCGAAWATIQILCASFRVCALVCHITQTHARTQCDRLKASIYVCMYV